MYVKVKDGHVLDDGATIHKPGDTAELSSSEGKRLIKQGVVQKAKAPELKEATIEEIRDAISLLDTEDPKLWTQNSGPQLDALRGVLNAQVTSAQRDEAWELHKAAQQ